MSEDALGTLRGRIGEGPRLLIGSHIDTVIDAGKYDGPLGVIAGILAVAHFGGKPPLPIDVLAFGDEEGSRFPATLTSSAACAGAFEPEALELADRNGVTLRRRAAGLRQESRRHPRGRLQARRSRGLCRGAYRAGAACWRPKTSRSASSPASSGRAAARHRDRRGRTRRHRADESAARRARRRAEMALAAERSRAHAEDGMVATVGIVEASPGAVNIIPGRVVFTVDLRCADRCAAQWPRSSNSRRRRARSPPRASSRLRFEHVPRNRRRALRRRAAGRARRRDRRSRRHMPIRLPSGAGPRRDR